ncbi:MAG: CBS domain-containing protein [Candidatus Bathyarchaeia archaeon]
MKTLKVSYAMNRDIVVVDEGVSIKEAAKLMREKASGCAIVLTKSRPIGMVTERDITYKVAGEGLDPNSVRVKEIMSTPLITIDPDADLMEAAKLMERHRIRRLAVARGEILYGIINAADIARHLEGYVDQEIRRILRSVFFPSPGRL